MKEVYLFFLLLTGGLGAMCFLVTSSLYLSLGVAGLTVIILFFMVVPAIRKSQNVQQKRHESYLFINTFLITLSVCQSIEKSYEMAIEPAEKGFRETLNGIAHLDAMARVRYLSSYFEQPIYDMFLSILQIYLEQGGDVLKLSTTLMEELTRIEETAISLSKHAAGVLVQWIMLWTMSLAILGFARFGLNSFYDYLRNSPSYLLMVVLYFILVDVSIVIFTSQYTGVLPWKSRIRSPRIPREVEA